MTVTIGGAWLQRVEVIHADHWITGFVWVKILTLIFECLIQRFSSKNIQGPIVSLLLMRETCLLRDRTFSVKYLILLQVV